MTRFLTDSSMESNQLQYDLGDSKTLCGRVDCFSKTIYSPRVAGPVFGLLSARMKDSKNQRINELITTVLDTVVQ